LRYIGRQGQDGGEKGCKINTKIDFAFGNTSGEVELNVLPAVNFRRDSHRMPLQVPPDATRSKPDKRLS
jgi:hypothetical protein